MSTGDLHTKYDINNGEFDKAIDMLDNKDVVFNTQYDIPYLAGTSIDGKTIYRDKQTPSGYESISGKHVDTDRYFKVHERVEKAFLDQGFPYILAHQCAEQMERAAVINDGHDYDEYDRIIEGWVGEVGNRATYQVPHDLCLTPYKDCDDWETLKKMHGLPDIGIEMVAKKIR